MSAPSRIPSIVPTILPNLSDFKIIQKIWSLIFDDKQDPKDLNRYNGNKNYWSKFKYN